MRAIGFISVQASAVKRRARADTVRPLCCGDHRHRPAHAIACCADFARCIHGALRVEPIDKGMGIYAVRLLGQGAGIRNDFLAYARVAKGLARLD